MSLKKIVLTLSLILSLTAHLFSQTDENFMASGIKNYQEGKYIDSIYFFNRVIEQEDELYSEALFWRSRSFYSLEYFKDAKENLELFFKKANLSTSYYEDARFLYCKVYFKLGRFQDSLFLFNQFYRTESFKFYKVTSLFWIGECYLQLSKLNESKEAFEKYLTYKPTNKTAKERLDLVNNMLSIINKSDSIENSINKKADWFVEYIINEDKTRGDITFNSLLESFNTKNDFFKWLDKIVISANAKSFIINEAADPKVDKKTPVSEKEKSVISKNETSDEESSTESGKKSDVVTKDDSNNISDEKVEGSLSEDIDLDLLEILISNELESRLLDKGEANN